MHVLKTNRLASGGKCLVALAAGLLLAGCSSVVNSHKQKSDMMAAYMDGRNDEVQEEVYYKLREPTWYNTSVVGSVDELMWRLESGSMNFHLGNFEESIEQFRIAEDLIADYDERAIICIRDAADETGSAFVNLNLLPYRGFCRDRMALSIYKSLAYLGAGREDSFFAQIRRLRDEQKEAQEKFASYFEEEDKLLDESKDEHKKEIDDLKKDKGTDLSNENEDENVNALASGMDNDDFAEGLEQVREVANRGYGNFLNPAAIFLSALGSVRDDNYENARIDFERLYKAMPKNPLFQRYYVTAQKITDRDIPSDLADVKPFDFPLDRNCVYVIFANGRSAAFEAINIYFPIMTAWPMCEFYEAPFKGLTAQVGEKQYQTGILADMDGILAQEFNDRLPYMITRIVLNTLIKESAYYVSLAAILASDMDPVVKSVAFLSVAIGGAVYRAAVNTADTRSWEILPKEFQLTQFPMPEDRKVSLNLTGYSNVSETLTLPENCDSAVIFVDAPSEDNVAFHVFPLPSR